MKNEIVEASSKSFRERLDGKVLPFAIRFLAEFIASVIAKITRETILLLFCRRRKQSSVTADKPLHPAAF